MYVGRNDVIPHATCASLPRERRMVLTFYTKHALTTLMSKMKIFPNTNFFKNADDQDWTHPPPGWGDSEYEYVTVLEPRRATQQEWEMGAQAMCQYGDKRLPVEVLGFHPKGLPLQPEMGPCYEVRWLRSGGRRSDDQYSTVPKGDLSGPGRWRKKKRK